MKGEIMTTQCRVTERETHEVHYYKDVISIHEVFTEYGLSAWQMTMANGHTATFHRQDWKVEMLDWRDAREWEGEE